MANEVGINFRVDAQTDGLKRAIPDFKAFQDQVSSVLGITDPEIAESYWQEYNSGLEKSVRIANELSLIQQRNRRAEGGEGEEDPGRRRGSGGDSDSGRVLAFPSRSILSNARTVSGLLASSSKDAVGAGLQAGGSLVEEGLSRMAALPTAAKIAVGAGAGLVGVGLVGNALSKQYEAVIPQLLEATAALKRFGETADDQGKKFRTTMDQVSETSSKYGYSLEQGLSLITQAARGGAGVGRTGDAYQAQITGVMEKVMNASIALGMTTPSGQLADLAILGSRFKQDNALNVALGGANNVFGSQRAEETATALASMFEDVLDQGIEASFKELGATQNWLYRVFGERAVGAGGANIFAGLSGAVRGSTSLSNETDILKYQAARNLTGGDPLKALMKLEEGFTVDIFKSFQDLISGASEWDKMFLTSKAFGVTLSTASLMWQDPKKAKEYYEDEIAGGGGRIRETPEVGIRGIQERIANELRGVGDEAFNIKFAVLRSTDRIIQAILHPESEQFPLTPVDPKGSFEVNRAEKEKGFTDLFYYGGPAGGFGGDTLESREFIVSRYGRDERKIASGLDTLSYIVNALHDDTLMQRVSPEILASWNKINQNDPKVTWSATEIDDLWTAIKAQFPDYQGIPAEYGKVGSAKIPTEYGKVGSAKIPTAGIFGNLEASFRNSRIQKGNIPSGETENRSLWSVATDLMEKTRGSFALLPDKERKELLDIEMRDKKAGFSESELKAVIKLLEQIAQYTGDFTKMDLTISPDLFK